METGSLVIAASYLFRGIASTTGSTIRYGRPQVGVASIPTNLQE